jgi:hypothetical protein
MHRALERLVRLAKKHGLTLRQSYERVGKRALIAHQRHGHAKQFKRAIRALRTLCTYLGRVTRDIMRKIKGKAELENVFALPLSLSRRVREQRKNQRGPKVYSPHAPEVECIGKGKAHRPYDFGVKVSIATTLHHSKGGQFIAHAKALPGNPYDGHTLAAVIPEIETQIGVSLLRIVAHAATAATMRRPTIASRSIFPARNGASPNTSNASCDDVPLSSRSSATPKASIGWVAIIWPGQPAAQSTPSSPPPATTSGGCWPGWRSCCLLSYS